MTDTSLYADCTAAGTASDRDPTCDHPPQSEATFTDAGYEWVACHACRRKWRIWRLPAEPTARRYSFTRVHGAGAVDRTEFAATGFPEAAEIAGWLGYDPAHGSIWLWDESEHGWISCGYSDLDSFGRSPLSPLAQAGVE